MQLTLSKSLRIILPALLLATAAAAQQNVWRLQGPANLGVINDLAIVDSIAYAGTWNGVFRSDDGGEHWRQSGLAGENVRRIEARTGASIFAITYSGALYASRDASESWSRVLDVPSLREVAIDPVEPSTVYAAPSEAYPSPILKSTDAGASWQELPIHMPNGDFEFVLMHDAIYMYAPWQVQKSVDGGLSWTSIALPMPEPRAIAGGATSGAVYLAGWLSFCQSLDAAVTWTCSAFPGVPLGILEVPGAGVPPRLFALNGGGLVRSLDCGVTWEAVAGGLNISSWVKLPVADSAGSLLLAGADGGAFRSTSGGDSWEFSSDGLVATGISALAVDPSMPTNVWASVHAGGNPRFFRSIDAGESWSPADTTHQYGADAILIDPRNSSTMYVSSESESALFRSEDAGHTWAKTGQSFRFLTLDPHDPDRLWASDGFKLYRSDDGARSFTAVSTLAQYVYSLVFDGRRPGTVYAGSYFAAVPDIRYPEFFFHLVGGSVFVSRDAGANWSKSAKDFGSAVSAIANDPFVDGTLYVGTRSGAVYRSSDDGASWTGSVVQPSAPVSMIVADPVRSGHLYAVTNSGVFRSTDHASTWLPFSMGLPPAKVLSFVISPDGSRLHTGTDGAGVFTLDLKTRPLFCKPSETRLCLVGSRYAVDLVAARKGESTFEPGSARPLGDRAGYFGLPSITGDPDLPEVVVKMLPDGAFGTSGVPVFYSSLTTLPYALTVTDTITGKLEVYTSNTDAPLCGSTDLPFGELEASMSPRSAFAAAAETALPLLGGRFSVTLEARHSRSGAIVRGVAMSSRDRFGFFSLPEVTGDPQFPEVVVKMLDFRTITGSFLLFYAGLTSADYTLTVTDTVTGAVRTYESPADYCGAAVVLPSSP